MPDKIDDPDFDAARVKREEREKLEELERAERELQIEEHEKIALDEIEGWAKKKKDRVLKVKEDLDILDKQVRSGLALILHEYSKSYQFNQQLLEDIVPLVVKRSKILKKLKK